VRNRRLVVIRNFSSGLLLVLLFGAGTTVAGPAEMYRGSCLSGDEQTTPTSASENTATLLDDAFCSMYDLDFGKAESALAEFTASRPDDPMGPAAQAASVLFLILAQHQILQTQFFVSDDHLRKRQKIVPDRAKLQHMETALHRAEQLAAQALARSSSDENALFAMTLVYGLRADYAALVDHQEFAALRFSNQGNEWARKLLRVSPGFYDAYVATGIEKYLVGLKPAPVRWMLRLGGIKGNRDEGLEELELAAHKGHYLAPFARILLAIAYLRKQEQPKSVEILTALARQFPHNPLFSEELASLTDKVATPSRQVPTLGDTTGNTSN
jgi:hypothetical protein